MILDDIFEVSGFGELDVSQRLQKYFTDRGYRIMGEGRDQMVFHRPGQRHVIKVIGQSEWDTERGDTIADYVRFFAANQANPHFPRVSPPREIDVDDEIYTIYRQELLQDLSDDEEERLLDWIQAFGDALGDQWHMGPGSVKAWLQNNPPPRSLPLRQVQGLYAAVSKLLRHYGDDLTGARRLDLGHAANFMQRDDGTIVVVDPIAYDEDYGQFSEATRRDVLKGMGAAAGAAALPGKTLARALAPTTTATTAAAPVGGYVWTRIGDVLDQQHLSTTVNSILRNYRFIALGSQQDWPDEDALKTKLHQVLRKHVPSMGPADPANKNSRAQWNALTKDLKNIFPMPKLPADLPDLHADADEWQSWLDDNPTVDEDKAMWMAEIKGLEDGLHQGLVHLAKVTRDANLGDTEDYGYKVNHKIKTGEITPVDYSKTGSAAAQVAQTVATQAPRGAIASTLGTAGAALRDLGRRARDYVTKKGIKTVAPRALAAPTTDAELMRDLQNRVTEPQKQKVDEITIGSEAELFAGGGFLPRIDVDPEDSDLRPLDQRYALWPQRHIQEIAREDSAIGEEFSDWDTAGILDTQTGRAVAFIAWEEAYQSPFPGAVEIHQVEVDPRLRGQGFARYLYELVRRQHTLLADDDQTPNGARMWVGMQQAGLPVQGYISFGSGRTPEELDAEGENRFSYVEELKKMNARLINPGGRFPVYVFPVRAQGGRLDTPANTPLKVYRSGYSNQWTPGLVAPKG